MNDVECNRAPHCGCTRSPSKPNSPNDWALVDSLLRTFIGGMARAVALQTINPHGGFESHTKLLVLRYA